MAYKREKSKLEEIFDLALTHEDLVDMMNDPQVMIDGGEVSENQTFQIVLRKSSGTETILKEMSPTDTLVVRFTKVTISSDDTEFNDVDIS